jgi:hypothetical protein
LVSNTPTTYLINTKKILKKLKIMQEQIIYDYDHQKTVIEKEFQLKKNNYLQAQTKKTSEVYQEGISSTVLKFSFNKE